MGHGCVVNQWVELLANQWVGLLACSGMAMHAISARGRVAWHCGEPLGLEWHGCVIYSGRGYICHGHGHICGQSVDLATWQWEWLCLTMGVAV